MRVQDSGRGIVAAAVGAMLALGVPAAVAQAGRRFEFRPAEA